jgi:DNA polymerase-3 subunit alpha
LGRAYHRYGQLATLQIAWQLHDDMGKLIEHQDYLVKPDGLYDAERIHGISTELAAEKESPSGVGKFNALVSGLNSL